MANIWLSVPSQPETKKCYHQTLIHTSMHSPWQQVSTYSMGVYCFGSCMSLSGLCALHIMWSVVRLCLLSHSACPLLILDGVNTPLWRLTVHSNRRSRKRAALCPGSEISTSFLNTSLWKAQFPPRNEQPFSSKQWLDEVRKKGKKKTKRLEIICVKGWRRE